MRLIPSWSRGTSRAAMLVVIALLAACSMFAHVATLKQVRAKLTGMTLAEVADCMGQPDGTLTSREGLPLLWTYTSRPDISSPSPAMTDRGKPAAADVPTPLPAVCMMVLTIGNGRVTDVHYGNVDGTPATLPESCGVLARRCFQ